MSLATIQSAALLLVGGVLLYVGAEWLVRGAAGMATKLRVRPLVIGLTIVAYGTSVPELVVSVGAALRGRAGIAFGNAVGSNIVNIALILGMTALIAPPKVDPSLLRRELPVMVLSALAVPLLLLDGRLSRLEGIGLLLSIFVYSVLAIRAARAAAAVADVEEDARRRAANAPKIDSTAKLALIALFGLAFVLLGGRWFVDGASGVALQLGVSERLIGLTIVAIGTSLPELATSLIAARRGHPDIAVGTIVGSNIFNVLLILGASSVIWPLDVPLRSSGVELVGLGVTTLVGAFFLRSDRTLSRREGAILVVLYVVFLIALVLAPR